ncbi:MAG TPA: protease Lon-related BREX system protein BrxL [Ktedonobacterales bacterium]|nr:protease Lon-related BREX system protein BrxL [Ktedonobacterales bacterium]
MTEGEFDRKVSDVFAGKVVRKDLVRTVKVGANVPVYVLEYLLGKYCATDDPAAIQAGMRLVNFTLSENFIRPDEANKAMFAVKDRGQGTYIDKIRVRSTERDDWGEMANFGNRYLHVPDHLVRQYPRLLEGGIWAQVNLEYRGDEDDERDSHPFYVTDLKPIQLAGFALAEYVVGRKAFTTAEWTDLILRSIGVEPDGMSSRLKLLFLSRLIPMVERNYNFIELGPRGTGKSFVYRETTPYAILVSGGKTTVANLFYNMGTGKMGLVGLWDVVAFDEVAGIQFSDKSAIQILKDYMESGSFSRGREELGADASMVFLGNINQPVDVLVRTSHLFNPLPDAMRDDMAFIDRLHFYLPGWEMPKMVSHLQTEHYGFVVDYLAEAVRELRKQNFTDVIDAHYSLGSHLNTRDAKAVRKTVSGLVKLLHPDREVTAHELREYLELALEGRRRVKEQLKKLGSFEYYQTSFSYFEHETMQEHFVGVPEEGGRDLISSDPLAPGSVYAATLTEEDKVALHRIEVGKIANGSGKLKITGSPDTATKASLTTAYDYMRARARELGVDHELQHYDYHVQAVDLTGSGQRAQAGIAFFVALYSAIKERPVRAALVVLGDLTIQGNILPARSLAEPLQVAMDNGAKRALIPVENKRSFLEVAGDVVERVDPIFYGEPLAAALKAMGAE